MIFNINSTRGHTGSLLVTPIDEVMRGGRLRWFGHVQRRDSDNVTRRVMELAIPGAKIINVFRAWIGAQLTICAQK